MTRKKKQFIAEKLACIAKIAGIFIESDAAISDVCDNIVDIVYAVGGHRLAEEVLKIMHS